MAKKTKKDTTKKTEEEFVNPLDELELELVEAGDFTINFEDIDDSGPAPLPPGKYKAVITGVDVTTSQAGNPLIKLEFTIEHEGGTRKVWDNYVLNNEVGLSRLKQLVKIVAPDALTSFSVKRAPEYFMGKVVKLQIKQEPGRGQYAGRIFNRVQKVEPWTEIEELF